MPKIGIVPNLTRDKALDVTLKVTEQLDKLNIEYAFDKSLLNSFPVKIDSDKFTNKLYERSDIIIAIGGDGSFIHAAKQAAMRKKPVLCINAGNLAFLAGLEGNELGLLEKLISGDYVTDKRMMLKAVMKNSDGERALGYCLNDVVAARGAEIRLIDIDVLCDGRKINNYRADGVIISTPTGSTAYSWSAGGPVIDPTLECMTLTPICTHSPLNRSLVFGGDSVITIKPHTEHGVFSVSTDGEDAITVSNGAEIIISKSELFAEFIRIKSDEFFDILNSKLKVGRTDEKETT